MDSPGACATVHVSVTPVFIDVPIFGIPFTVFIVLEVGADIVVGLLVFTGDGNDCIPGVAYDLGVLGSFFGRGVLVVVDFLHEKLSPIAYRW